MTHPESGHPTRHQEEDAGNELRAGLQQDEKSRKKPPVHPYTQHGLLETRMLSGLEQGGEDVSNEEGSGDTPSSQDASGLAF